MSAPHDPWKNVETFIADICLRDGDMLDVDVCLRTAVDAARAADAAQHQQEIDEKDKRLARWEGDGGLHAAVAELNGYGPDWPTHGNAPLAIAAGYALLKSRAEQAEAEIATLRATVEQQAARITELEQRVEQESEVARFHTALARDLRVQLNEKLAAVNQTLIERDVARRDLAKALTLGDLAYSEQRITAQAARITALEQALKQVLRFQYEHRGMGTYACRSCGAQAQLDEWVGIQRREACSPSCPWGVARQALETP